MDELIDLGKVTGAGGEDCVRRDFVADFEKNGISKSLTE